MAVLRLAADYEDSLFSSVNTGDTTATLTLGTDSDGIVLADGTYGFTIDNNSDNKEYITCTLTGGTVVTAVQSITRQGVATSGFANFHRKGAVVEITDWGALYFMTQALNGSAVYTVVPLTDSATIATNAALGTVFDVTLGGNRTLGAPTNPSDGQVIEYRVMQDATGNRTLAYNAIFGFTADVPSPTLSTGANKIDFLLFQYKSAQTKWFCLAVNKGAN